MAEVRALTADRGSIFSVDCTALGDKCPTIPCVGANGRYGSPKRALSMNAFSLLFHRRSIAGTLIGGIAETQEMLDFCGVHGIGAEVEIIDANHIDEAYERVLAGDVRFRLVIDASPMTNA